MNMCSFKEKQKVKFTKAYFPSLVNAQPVKNTYKIDKNLIITGPNAAGKTTLLKATIFNIILSQQLGYGFYKKANIIPYDMIHCYINIPDTSARDSLFQAEAKRCKDILTKIELDGLASAVGANAVGPNAVGADANAVGPNAVGPNAVGPNAVGPNAVGPNAVGPNAVGPNTVVKKETSFSNKKQRHFCVFDELYSGTNPYEAISSAYAFLTYLNKYEKVNFVLTTHFLDLCRRLEKERAIQNHHMKIETINDDFKYTYKLEKGISYIKGGVKVLKDLEYPLEIIQTTNATLQELDI
jgi:DNA mismatch repair ATPase MutS